MPNGAASAQAAGTYVYGVVRAGSAPGDLFDHVSGVAAGAAVEVVEHGTVAALVSRVPLADFGADALEERLRDPVWVAQRAQAHGRVLEAALAAGAVVPFRFGAIFHGREDVEALLAAREGELAAALAHVAGRVELGVKAFAPADLGERVRAALPAARELAQELETVPPGRRYLLEKQLQQLVAREIAAVRARIAEESHAALAATAAGAVVNAPQDASLAGSAREMLLNGAYLVDAAAQEELRAAVERLRRRFGELGIRFEVTGPWPPFNFVEGGGA